MWVNTIQNPLSTVQVGSVCGGDQACHRSNRLIVEHLFGVQIVCICRILLSYVDEKEEEERKKEEQIETFAFDFLDCEEKSLDSGAIFEIRKAKGFHL